MANQRDQDPSASGVDLDQAMKDEALKKIENGEAALDHEPAPENDSTGAPATESGQQPREQ